MRQLEWMTEPPAPAPLAELRPRGLSFADAARYLGVSVRTVERLRASGSVSSYRIGRRVLLELDSLDRYSELGPADVERLWMEGR